MTLRAEAMKAGLSQTTGARHAEEFIKIIREKGTLDEPMLAIKTLGLSHFTKILSLIPVAWRSFVHRKLPAFGPFHRPLPGIARIRRIIDTLKDSP